MEDNIAPPPVQKILTTELGFDSDNPRFYRLNNEHSQEDLIEDMFDDEGVADLMRSIGQKGYFEGEPLLVTRENDKFIVVEGNRRLAAVKLLNGEITPPPKRTNSVKQIVEETIVEPPFELPCIIYPERRDVLRYLGYRHITGIKEWDSLSKAKYLAKIRTEFYAEETIDNQMRDLAKDIGSRSDYVAQLLTALNLYLHAERKSFFDLQMTAKDVVFSYITTALNYKRITDWLGLESKNDLEPGSLNEENLKSLFSWMFVKDQQGRTIIGESRRLSEIAAVVSDQAAVNVLKETSILDEAFLYSDGPQEALNNALQSAISKAESSWKLLLKVDPLNHSHLSLAEKLANSARDIRNHLRDKLED
ncbi:ParB N-terminal domain-containing protein [Porticoccus sp.]|jgi:hypothetical protein|uniref:ParB N-terminal domain-containing protein n=1 Tax=Porticoccus sp. TaxID=2024853 RepID=UPI000C632DD0|nr:ParB N-terminal domain-containing protein [Porticoccus sp.]MAZ70272.1 hypothetical protein [Porticoccus sp.]|tara:strand:+ start:211 stop:1299 length:1089 start_codon:yes stop_codon:yes gene_type:complete